MNWLTEHLKEWFFAAFGGLVIWIAKRATAKVDALEARTAALERDKATRGDIEALREHIDRSIAQSAASIGSRTDQILMLLARKDGR
jgi:hypothetical protein